MNEYLEEMTQLLTQLVINFQILKFKVNKYLLLSISK